MSQKESYLFFDPRFKKVPSAVCNTHEEYLPKENVAVKKSCLRVSLTLGQLLDEKSPSVLLSDGGYRGAGPDGHLSAACDILSYFPSPRVHHIRVLLLTTKHVASLKEHVVKRTITAC